MKIETSALAGRLIGWGFDVPKLRFTLRTAIAACLALLIAFLVGLEHPQWSAMTVFAAAQPTRGQILEKSVFRFLGTLVGALAGLALLFGAGGNAWVLVVGLSLWIALSVAAGNLFRGYLSYGAILAGFSAAMVVLLAQAHVYTPFALGLDRVLTVLVGVLAASVLGYLATPSVSEGDTVGRLRRLGADMLGAAAARLRGEAADTGFLLAAAAQIDDTLSAYAAGSLRARRHAGVLHRRLIALTDTLLLCASGVSEPDPATAGRLTAISERLHRQANPSGLPDDVRAAADGAVDPVLREALTVLANAVAKEPGATEPGAAVATEAVVEQHWDWVGARHAAIRAFCVLLGLGSLWAGTGWQAGPYMMLGGSVMISIFSTFDDPAWIMARLLFWQVWGAAASLVLKFVLWPLAGSELQTVLLIMPVLLVVVPLMSHKRTGVGSMDYAMVLLLISQPRYPFVAGFIPTLEQAIAVVAGPVIAYCAFLVIFPTNAQRRMKGLAQVMRGELRAMASARTVVGNAVLWRARFCTRLLKMIGWSGKTASARDAVQEEGFAVLGLGQAIYLLRGLRHTTAVADGTKRAGDVALTRLARDAGRSPATLAAIERTTRRLEADAPELAARLRRYTGPAMRAPGESG
ncbi:putative membrane protein YccC [Breoghania corrubedonensis]|uniref:Putative membrane protein YccC n=1 Tax=Breoghania corrubedonensis TaxID=665038 RepID=A0A2T5VF34_9HYPH|nr:FUSC family protein [Breoghania corrubedonensis]PTW62365.1 putative membrane protein YccC [Breoghania corrubedonensis]